MTRMLGGARFEDADRGLAGADRAQVASDGAVGFGAEVLGLEELFEVAVAGVAVDLGALASGFARAWCAMPSSARTSGSFALK